MFSLQANESGLKIGNRNNYTARSKSKSHRYKIKTLGRLLEERVSH